MSSQNLLILFVVLRTSQFIFESYLAFRNNTAILNPQNQFKAKSALQISDLEMSKAIDYTMDRYKFSRISDAFGFVVSLSFIGLGGLGLVEGFTQGLTQSTLANALFFLANLGLLSGLVSLPFDYYQTFVIEQRHGFNKQTPQGFVLDRIKGALIATILGGAIVSVVLWIMENLANWWIWAWLIIFAFNLMVAWLYPTLLAPIFNKFKPLEDGPLKEQLFALAKDVEFHAGDISVMDASSRTAHGNAYFTGVFGKKKIVLFDTLIAAMNPKEICAVLAHELGHFKLHHIRASLLLSFAMTGVMFYALSVCLPIAAFYEAFSLSSVTNYGGLVVFSLWFSMIGFLIQPLTTLLSRRNEFAADAFALEHINDKRLLGDALLKLRENSKSMPISDPFYSAVYHSHPPLLERLTAMGYI